MQSRPPSLIESLNAQERAALSTFIETVQTQLANSPDEHTAARFLKARKFDLAKAMEMYRKYLGWRQEFGTDEILSFKVPEVSRIKEFYPHGYHKTDRMGRPIYIERLGQLNLNRLFEETSEERMIRYSVREYEKLIREIFPACSQAAGYPVEQTMTILDLGGASMKLLSKRVYGFVKLLSGVAQDYYPEILGNMFIVNSPMLFSGAWAMIKPWLDKRTQQKITIVGKNYREQLFNLVDPQNLPSFLGGSCLCPNGCLNSHIGPWNPSGIALSEE